MSEKMHISTQADLQTAAEILELLSSRLGNAEYAAPGGMVYVGYVETEQLTRARAQAKVLRSIISREALSAPPEGGREQGIEEAARVAETFFGKAHTYASENADLYRAQDETCRRIAKAIRALTSPDTPDGK